MSEDIFAILGSRQNFNLISLLEPLLQDSLALGDRTAEILLDKPEICLGAISKINSSPSHWHYEGGSLILQGKICGGFTPDASWLERDWQTLSDRLENGVYNLLVWCDRRKSLFVTSDYLSTKALYYWQQGETTVISSTLKAFRLLPFIPQKLNPQVLASTLALSNPFSDDTLIEGIKTIPINCAGVFQQGRIDFIPRNKTNQGIDNNTEAEAIAHLDGLLAKSLETWLEDSPHALLALSGGLDSRLLLGYLQRSGKQITAATWGEAKSDDFKLGVALAKANNIEHLSYILRGDEAIAEADLKFPGWQTESFSVNNVPFYWQGWLDLLETQQLPVIHGFLGGPLGGGRLTKWGIAPNDFASEVDATIVDSLRTYGESATSDLLLGFATPKLAPYLTTGLGRDLTVAFQNIDRPHVYQRLMCMDFYYRQRRYLGNAISKIMGTFVPTLLPFYTKDNLDFVLQLPLELILGRKIFRKLLLQQFPQLANFQEADKGTLPIYSSALQKYLDRLKENRYMWYLFPQTKPRNSALVFSSLLSKNLPIILPTIEDSSPILGDYLDIDKIITTLKTAKISPRDRGDIIRLFNIATFINHYFETQVLH